MRETEDGDAADHRDQAHHHEGHLIGEQVEVEDEKDNYESRECARLHEGAQASEDVAAPLLRGQTHAHGELGLQDGMHAEATDEDPGDHRKETRRDAEEGEPETHDDHGARAQPRYRHPVEKRHQQDEYEASELADGRHVPELRTTRS